MKEMYHVKGTVNRGFVGQITYTVCLEQPCTALDIHLTYDFAELRYRDGDVTPKEQKKYFKTKKHFSARDFPEFTPQNPVRRFYFNI